MLPHLRAQRSGTVIDLSSSGGFVSRTGWGVNCAAKFAIEGLTEALKLELAPLGLRVIAIEPGAFRTDALKASSLATVIDDYAGTAGKTRQVAAAANHAQPKDPVKAARVTIDLAGAGAKRTVATVIR